MNGRPPPPAQSDPTVPKKTAAPENTDAPEHTGSDSEKAHVKTNPIANAVSRLSVMQMTAVVVLVIFLWQWLAANRQVDTIQQDVARRLAEMEGNNKASQVLAMQALESGRQLAAQVSLLEARYAEAQNQRASLEALYQELSSSRDEMVLADVEQMLFIAGQQLQLSANVKAALIAMQQADEQLQRMDRVALNSLRQAISRDMEKLRALPDLNLSAINGELDDLIIAVDSLPLQQDRIRQPQADLPISQTRTEGNVWQRLLREIWDDAKSLVRIEKMHQNEAPLLAPTQVFFLRENLKSRLLSARLALLSHDDPSYKLDLKLAQEWLVRYFDNTSAATTQAINRLNKLRQSSIHIELPDVSASLEAARNYRASSGKLIK